MCLKTVYQKFKLIWYKTHDFSTIDMIIKTKLMFFDRVSEVRAVKAQPYSGKGGRERQLIRISRDMHENSVHYQNDIINYLWGILS